MKERKILGVFLSVMMLLGIPCSTMVNAQTKNTTPEMTNPIMEWYLPQHLKIGDWVKDVSSNPGQSTGGMYGDWQIGTVSNVSDLEGCYVYSTGLEEYAFDTHAGGGEK